ncbi:hypothetical protein [Nisaea nitritireducens]|uniref:hypothetical protein n=1 Tax=Nisaea nitritireducens TaxID=568392 RepID=UPI0018677E24|nr:hypothetical protein [Nisaea nitritireducens]
MKVFWSWQSDRSGKTGRYFVRDCLLAAIERLNDERNETSQLEPAARDEIELDQDRKGVKGSPGLADTIYAKIREVAVVICDVTPVIELVSVDGRTKKLTNPNVAIELGYAQGTLGDASVLMVLNLEFGRHEELAFDLRHKTGILSYNLPDGAVSTEIKAEAKKFTSLLVEALRPYVEEPAAAAAAEALGPFDCADSTTDSARWWEPDEVLGQLRRDGSNLMSPSGPLIYLRLMPPHEVPRIAAADLHDYARHFTTFDGGFNLCRNRNGVVLIKRAGGNGDAPFEVSSATQLFETGEVWAVEAYLLREEAGRGPGWPYVPIGALEHQTRRTLTITARAMVEHFNTPLPISIEFGMAPSEGFRFPLGDHNWSGPCFMSEITLQAQLTALDDASIEDCLGSLYEGFWDRFGERRPVNHGIEG